ncbi:MAG: protein translocase subunit SecF [Bacteroidetes bacterium]|nr:protein translocase subunit SecF [Bacteroidota bacterium]
MRFFKKTNIDFMGKRKIWYSVSGIILLTGLLAAFIKGPTFGIDFTGGTELLIRFDNVPKINELRDAISEIGFQKAEIKTFGNKNDILIRTSESGKSGLVAENIRIGLSQKFVDKPFTVLKEEKVGPRIGAELKRDAIYAVIFTMLGIMIYVGFRFKFIYGVAGVIALIHDILATFGIIIIIDGLSPYFNLELSQNLMAAFLTLIGFSINDTVVIFDRIRENEKIHRAESLHTLINRSVNETLSRTLITNGTVFLVLLVLVIFGGEVNRGFALTFFIGTIFGSYSTIYIASSIVLDWSLKAKK